MKTQVPAVKESYPSRSHNDEDPARNSDAGASESVAGTLSGGPASPTSTISVIRRSLDVFSLLNMLSKRVMMQEMGKRRLLQDPWKDMLDNRCMGSAVEDQHAWYDTFVYPSIYPSMNPVPMPSTNDP